MQAVNRFITRLGCPRGHGMKRNESKLHEAASILIRLTVDLGLLRYRYLQPYMNFCVDHPHDYKCESVKDLYIWFESL